MADPEADAILDARGLFCPEPIMLLHKEIRALASGGTLLMMATDPSTERDLIKFCQFLDHELVSSEQKDEAFYFTIKKKENFS